MTESMDFRYKKLLKSFNENTEWFDEDFLEIATKIKYTPFALTESEWNDIYEKVKDDEKILWFMIKNKECPYDIIKKIVDNPTTNLFTDQILSLETLQENEINILINRQGQPHIEELLKSVVSSGRCPYSKAVIEYMIDHKKSYGFAELAYTDNVEHIKKVMQENEENEQAMLMIANNKHLPDSIRNAAYDNCDWNSVYFQTDYMNKTIYQGIAQTVFEIDNENETKEVWTDTFHLLIDKLKKGQIPESCQVDLIHRSASLPSYFQGELLSTTATHAKSKFVLDIVWEVGDKNVKMNVATNKNSSNEHRLKFIEDIVNDNTLRFNPALTSLFENTELTYDLYSKILEGNRVDLIKQIVNSTETPINILEKIKNYNETQNEYANIAVMCKQNGIAKYQQSIMKSVEHFIWKKDVIPLLENPLNEKYNEFAPFFAGIEPKNNNEKEYVDSIVDKIIENAKDKTTIKALGFYKQCLNRYTKHHFAIENANRLFKAKFDENGKRIVNISDYNIIRNEKEEDIKKQIELLDTGLLAKIEKIIQHRCHMAGQIHYGGEPADIVEAHLAIEGYADAYNLIQEEIRSRMVKDFEERVDDDGFEK